MNLGNHGNRYQYTKEAHISVLDGLMFGVMHKKCKFLESESHWKNSFCIVEV